MDDPTKRPEAYDDYDVRVGPDSVRREADEYWDKVFAMGAEPEAKAAVRRMPARKVAVRKPRAA